MTTQTIAKPPRLPNRETIESRLDAAREQVFQAMGVCGTAKVALIEGARAIDGSLPVYVAGDCECALRAAYSILDRVAATLDPDLLLKAETAAGE